MKKTISIVILLLLALLATWYMFIYEPVKFDLAPYEHKIDSLQNEVDSFIVNNNALEQSISVLEDNNVYLINTNNVLEAKVSNLKGDLKKAKDALKYTPSEVDSFFVSNYTEEYSKKSIDTTYLPFEVSKAIIVDLKEGEINEQIVIAQDSTISNFKSLVQNKDTVISLLRLKEDNYLAIDKNRLGQIDNYKMQVSGLKSDLNSVNRKLKFGRIQKVALVAAILGFIIIK
jgi:predicted  nucleic acid-binding Zn-ribbon protein